MGLSIAGPRRGLELLDELADLEDRLEEFRVALGLERRLSRRVELHLLEHGARRRGEDEDVIGEVHGLLDRVRDEEDRRRLLAPQLDHHVLHAAARGWI